MEKPLKGDIVVVPFPFSDLSSAKRRPSLVLASLQGDDLVLCEITSRKTKDSYVVPLHSEDFVSGSLDRESTIRVNKLFTADQTIVLYKAGAVSKSVLSQAVETALRMLKE